MKKLILLASLPLLLACNNFDSTDELNDLLTIEEILVCPKSTCDEFGATIVYTGVSSEEYFIDPWDSLKAYYFEGKLKQLSVIKLNVRHGSYLEFDEKGNLKLFGMTKHGAAYGFRQIHDSSGEVIRNFVVLDDVIVLDSKE